MEEILASIRRIIADDTTLASGRRDRDDRRRREAEADEQAPAEQEADLASQEFAVSESTPQPAPVADIRRLRLNRIGQEPGPVVDEAEEAYDDEREYSVALVASAEEEPANFEAPHDDALVSADTAASVASHFQALAASMIINDSGLLQKYSEEMMRPMLKQWLDDNLPVIVERLVRAEIERVARGGRRGGGF